MSKKSYRIFVDGAGMDCVGHQVLGPCFVAEKVNGDVMYFPWEGIAQSIRVEGKGFELARKEAQEAQAEKPKIQVPPKGIITPFDKNAPSN